MSTTPATTTTAGPSASSALFGTSSSASSPQASSSGQVGTAESFLKLLVTQMQNQDPLNPADNAQLTSQLAQINTVNGIDKLNTAVTSLGTQFQQMQVLQGAGLVGHDVLLQGDRVDVREGSGAGSFDLAGTASNVKVEILSSAGRVVDTVNLGTETQGRHAFEWDASKFASGDYHFRVVAKAGTATVNATPLTRDRVDSVTTKSGQLVVSTDHSGEVGYADIKAFN